VPKKECQQISAGAENECQQPVNALGAGVATAGLRMQSCMLEAAGAGKTEFEMQRRTWKEKLRGQHAEFMKKYKQNSC
jgi:hypothetical protein